MSLNASRSPFKPVFGSAFLPPAEQPRGVEWESRLRHVHLVGVIVDVDLYPFKFVRFALDDGSMAASCATPSPSLAHAASSAASPIPVRAASSATSAMQPHAVLCANQDSFRASSARFSAAPPAGMPTAQPREALPSAALPAPPPATCASATCPTRAVPCVLWLNSHNHAERHVAMLQAATCIHVGALVGVRGRVMVFKGRRQVVVESVYHVSDPNEEILHWLDCLHALRSTQRL